MQSSAPLPVKPRSPELTALFGGVCIGGGLFYVRRYKTGAACVAMAALFVWMWYHYHILWSLWFLAVLWYWQMWYGYAKAEEFNDGLQIQLELQKSFQLTQSGKSP